MTRVPCVLDGLEQVMVVDGVANEITIISAGGTEEYSAAAEQEERRRSSERELLRIVSETGVLGLRTG